MTKTIIKLCVRKKSYFTFPLSWNLYQTRNMKEYNSRNSCTVHNAAQYSFNTTGCLWLVLYLEVPVVEILEVLGQRSAHCKFNFPGVHLE